MLYLQFIFLGLSFLACINILLTLILLEPKVVSFFRLRYSCRTHNFDPLFERLQVPLPFFDKIHVNMYVFASELNLIDCRCRNTVVFQAGAGTGVHEAS